MDHAVPAAGCRLCGTPLTGAAAEAGAFCCAGCARVHQVLTGLEPGAAARYLEASRRLGLIPSDPAAPAAAAELSPSNALDQREHRFAVEGMTCPSCSWVVEQVLRSRPEVGRTEVDYFTATASLSVDARVDAARELGELLAPLGYRLVPITDEQRRRLSGRSTMAFVIAALFTMNVMSLASVRYFEAFGWIDAAPPLLRWLELVLLVPVLVVGWLPMARRALAALARRRPTMDLLIATGALAATALGVAALVTGRDDIYFETAAGLITISLLSRMIEARLRERIFGDFQNLLRMPVVHARRIGADGEVSYTAAAEVSRGDRLRFEADEPIPFDGRVEAGRGLVSEAVLSGEPTPLPRVVGDPIRAGSRVVEGELTVVVERPFGETALARITESISRSLAQAGQQLRSSDRLVGWFVPLVLLIAIAVWVARWRLLGLEHALSAEGWFPSVAVLAVACPCAFSLAGITAVTAACGRLLRAGILVKETGQLELLAGTAGVVFDKTGTLTCGAMEVERVCWAEDEDPSLLPLVLAAERGSTHPVAHALRSFLADGGGAEIPAPAAPSEEIPGQGVAIEVAGRRFALGSAALFERPFEPPGIDPRHTVIFFGWDRRAAGAFLVLDRIRPEAPALVSALKAAGLELELLSGDRQEVTAHVGAAVGIDRARGGLDVERKLARIDELQRAGARWAFVGDGTNDALAMGRAGVSVALPRSADEALEAAGFVVLEENVGAVGELLAVGRRLARVIRGNHFWAFAFNALFIPVAAAGQLVPLAAMFLMLLSSTAVLANSARLRRVSGRQWWRPRPS